MPSRKLKYLSADGPLVGPVLLVVGRVWSGRPGWVSVNRVGWPWGRIDLKEGADLLAKVAELGWVAGGAVRANALVRVVHETTSEHHDLSDQAFEWAIYICIIFETGGQCVYRGAAIPHSPVVD